MALVELDSDEIAQIIFTVATPNAVCAILRARSDIAAIRRHLFDNAGDARRAIEEYVRERLIDLKPKAYFPHEPAFCALAVVLETLPMPAAEDFLSELSALKIAEMPISSHVAAICLQRRRELLISNTLAEFKVGPIQMPDASSPKRIDRLPRVPTETTYPDIFKAAA
ncbi:MAG: hypothetical protein FJ126_10800 [Deltaproteobacteria bacterium]|nr:hypothetical protein [Deltaproteobacteria bacterium]